MHEQNHNINILKGLQIPGPLPLLLFAPTRMAIMNYHTVHKSVPDGKREMSMAEFKEWIRQFDEDKDGRINKDDLREGIRATGAWLLGCPVGRPSSESKLQT